MTWPFAYQHASMDFERFMVAARDAAGLQTTNMAWTMVEGVFVAFRRRLTASQVLTFASVLPPLVRAMFLEGWRPVCEVEPFPSRRHLTEEVQSLRPQHNFAPENSIEAVAVALRSVVDRQPFDAALATLPVEAQAFWAVPPPAVGV